jgi:hypothetical protein
MPYNDEEGEWVGGESETDDEEDEDTLPCPYCRREVHVDSQRCPHCEQYISLEDAPPRPRPWWVTPTIIVLLAVTLFWLVVEVLFIARTTRE